MKPTILRFAIGEKSVAVGQQQAVKFYLTKYRLRFKEQYKGFALICFKNYKKT